MNIREPSTHWYDPDTGKPVFETNGHKTTVRDARTLGLVPGVTAVCKMYPNDSLKNWLRGQDIMAAATTVRLPWESDDEWIAKVLESADEEAHIAKEVGIRRHDMLHKFHKHTTIDAALGDFKFIEPYLAWLRENVSRIEEAEYVVVNRQLGYAGTVDLRCTLMDGRRALIDVKNRKRLATYDTDCMQLVAYAQAERTNGISIDAVISVVLGTDTPGIYVNEWLAVDTPWRNFQLCLELFRASKNLPLKTNGVPAATLPF